MTHAGLCGAVSWMCCVCVVGSMSGGNRFTDTGLTALLQAIPLSVRVLDISNNTMGMQSCVELARMLGRHGIKVSEVRCTVVCALVGVSVCVCRLTRACLHHQLNLSNTAMSDRLGAMVFRAISQQGHRARRVLTVLDVSRNKLGLRSAKALAEFLTGQCRLLRLSVAWNLLRGNAAVAFAQGIGVNTSIHVRSCMAGSVALLLSDCLLVFVCCVCSHPCLLAVSYALYASPTSASRRSTCLGMALDRLVQSHRLRVYPWLAHSSPTTCLCTST